MTPDEASAIRRFLYSVDRDHVVALPDGPCSCGDQVTPDDRPQHLLDKIAELVAEPDLAPHKVHVKGAIEAVPTEHVEAEADDPTDPREPGLAIKGSRYVGAWECPDCGLGLISRGDDMICIRLARDTKVKGCHLGCLVACGYGAAA